MNFLQASIMAIVEGVTEFLPISSTGHLILAADLLGIPQTNFVKSFEVIIQLGAILAVTLLYFHLLIRNRALIGKIFVAFLPTAAVGLILYRFIKEFLLGNVLVTLSALFVGGIALLGVEAFFKSRSRRLAGGAALTSHLEKLTHKQALAIGLCQSLAIVPGVSRAAATIVGGMLLGLDRKTAVEFSFLLAIPTMLAAAGLDLMKTRFVLTGSDYAILIVGFVGAFVTALFAVKFFVRFIAHNDFAPFGVYRIVLALVLWRVLL